MKKRYQRYIIILILFILLLLRNSYNHFIILLNHNFDYQKIVNLLNTNLIEENKRLGQIIDFQNTLDYDVITSKVKYRDLLDFSDTLTIYKGDKHHLKKGEVVLNEDGLIGLIKKTDQYTSIVQLITNKNSNISVKINDVYGILKYQDNHLIVSNITNFDLINEGDLIYTSGLTDIPSNIYVGKVKKITLSNLGIEKIVEVESKVDFNNLDYVLIVGLK